MANFSCAGCGRSDFFTRHGFEKHQRKCKGLIAKRGRTGSGSHLATRRLVEANTPLLKTYGVEEVSDDEDLEYEGAYLGEIKAYSVAEATRKAAERFRKDVHVFLVTGTRSRTTGKYIR